MTTSEDKVMSVIKSLSVAQRKMLIRVWGGRPSHTARWVHKGTATALARRGICVRVDRTVTQEKMQSAGRVDQWDQTYLQTDFWLTGFGQSVLHKIMEQDHYR